jgi:pantoate--beta-alanine ligase
VKVVGAPTMREKDGLAMSSRNVYLSQAERAAAPTLFRVLKECATGIAAGQSVSALLAKSREAITRAGFAIDYLEARHAQTLAPAISLQDGPLRLLVAAKIGKTRLIDNIAVRK